MSRISFDIEEYIKDMPPQLQQAARNCTTKEELMELANEMMLSFPCRHLNLLAAAAVQMIYLMKIRIIFS